MGAMESTVASDEPYAQASLQHLYGRPNEARQRETMAGPSGTYSIRTPPEDLGSPPVSDVEQQPTTVSRKHGLDAEWREPKRVSRQPTPISPRSPVKPAYQHTLPTRTVSGGAPVIDLTRQTFYDLTESNPPTPDPFPELTHAYRAADDGGRPDVSDTFNQDWMGVEELAAFMLEPTVPRGDAGVQQQSSPPPQSQPQSGDGFDITKREVPYFPGPYLPPWAAAETDSDDYGEFPLTGHEVNAIEKLFENIKDHGEVPEDREETPAIMTCVLKEYQRIGLTWLLKMERGNAKGGILADEMGLGKTVQALALMCANRSVDPLCKTTLIVAPVALMRQWEKEIERHVHARHSFSVYMYHGNGKNVDFSRLRTYDIVLTTFGTLTSEFKQKESRKESSFVQQEFNNPHFRRKAKDKLALLGRECMWRV